MDHEVYARQAAREDEIRRVMYGSHTGYEGGGSDTSYLERQIKELEDVVKTHENYINFLVEVVNMVIEAAVPTEDHYALNENIGNAYTRHMEEE